MSFVLTSKGLWQSFLDKWLPSRRGLIRHLPLRKKSCRLSVEVLEDRVAPAILTVNSAADTSNVGGVLTLRDAILVENGALAVASLSGAEQAQITGPLNAPGGDTIVFAPALAGQTISLTAFDDTSFGDSAFLINSQLTIQGDPTLGITIARDTNAADYPGGQLLDFRLFDVAAAGNLTLQNVTLANGLAQGGDGESQAVGGAGGGGAGMGGAVFNDGGSLTTLDCSFTNNNALGGQGGVYISTGIDGAVVGAGGGGAGSSDAGPYGGSTANGVGTDGGLGTGGGGGNGQLNDTGTGFPGGGGGFGAGGGGGGFGGSSSGGQGGAGGFGGGGGGAGGGAFGETGPGGAGGFGAGSGNSGGNESASAGGSGAGLGGAIFNAAGTVSITNTSLTGNTAQGGTASGGGDGSAYGGAIFNLNGSVTLSGDNLSGNTVAAATDASADGTDLYSLGANGVLASAAGSTTTIGSAAGAVVALAAQTTLGNGTGGANNLVNNNGNLYAIDHFTGGDAGNPTDWNDALNWDNGIPGADSEVIIPATGTTITSSSAVSILYIQSLAPVDITAGTFQLTAGGTDTGAFIVAGGATLGFDGASASTTFILGAGTSISGAGTVEFGNGTVNVAGTFDITGNTLVDGGFLNVNAGANVQSVGTLTISSGTVNFSSGQVIDLAALTMSGGTLAGPDDVSVAGLLDWTGGTIGGSQPGSQAGNPLNQAGSAFTTTPVDITNFSTQFTFQSLPVNDPGNDDIGITFTLQGTGPTALGDNNIYLGAYPIANSVSVEFNIGAPVFDGGYGNSGNSTNWISDDSNGNEVANSGSQWLSSINLNDADPFTVTMTYDGTTLQMTILDTITNATATQSYTMDIPALIGSSSAYIGFTGSTGSFAAEQSILSWQYTAAGANVDFSNGFSNTTGLSLNGSAISAQAQLQLTDGGQPEISAEGGLQLGAAGAANDTETLGRILNNAGAATWAGGGSFNQLYSTFNNLPGASFTIENGLDWSGSQYGGYFNNAGSLIVANGGTTTTIGSSYFVNTGSVEVQSGTLALQSGSGDAGETGSFTVDANATLEFAGSNDEFNLDAGSSISGAGTVQFDNPINNNVNIAGTYDITGTTVIIDGCAVEFTSSASLGSLSMAGSSLGASGSGTTVTATGPTNINNSNNIGSLGAQNGATLSLPNLTALDGSYIDVTSGGTLLLSSALTSLDQDNLTLDGTGTLDIHSWTSFTNGSITIYGGSYTLPGATDFDNSYANLSGGGVLSLPNLTSYSETSSYGSDGPGFTVDGAGSLLDLSAVVSMPSIPQSYWQVTNGGEINLASLPTLDLDGSNFSVDGAGSELDFASLRELANGNLSVTNYATIFAPDLTTLINANIYSDGTGTIDTGIAFTAASPPPPAVAAAYSYQFQAIGAGTITYSATGLPAWAQLDPSTGFLTGTPTAPGIVTFDVTASNGIGPDATVEVTLDVGSETFYITAGTTANIPAGNFLVGTIFNVGAGASVNFSDGSSFAGGMVFNVAPGATVDLTGGGTVTYAGTLTGTGSGTVQLTGGTFYPAVGGVTLNFPGNMFQWTGGAMELSVGDVTNLGTINLSGSGETQIYADGTLYNFGTIIQSGTGNFGLHSDNVSPTTLINEPGASYLIESDAGIDNDGLGDNVIDNLGTIRKTAGSGTSSLFIPSQGYITSTGTIEADSGTLYLDAATIDQISGNTLTGGTWNALSGATLQLPGGTAITSNAATIALDGSGATIAGIGGLATNSGSFSLTNGAAFITTGDFTNSGSLTLGTASTLTVAGNFTQTATGTLNEQIGDTPGSGAFGQLIATGTATLAGAFDLALVNGFTASAGQDFEAMTFASSSGTFSSANLGSAFTEAINPTSLDLNSTVANPTDLSVSNVDAPSAATAGQQITVAWQVTNTSTTDNATGTWQDSVYLSATPAITSSSILLGAVPTSGGLDATDSYDGSFTANVPALVPGFYYVIVEADSLYQVSQSSRANDIQTATTGQLDVTLPALTLGTAANGSFSAAGQENYYQVTVPAGGSLNVSLQSNASSGAVALYVSQGTLPTPFNYREAAASANQPNQTAVVPQVLTAGTYYILAFSVSGAAATAGYTITATQTAAVSIAAISPYSGGNAGNVTIEIDGTNFTPEATASLTLGTTILNASSMDFVNASQMFATFNLTGAAVGFYSLNVQQGAQSATAPSTFQVVAANAPSLNVDLSVPQFVRSGRTGTIVVTYTNKSANDIVAPLLDISSTNTNVSFSTPDDPNDYRQTAQVLAVAPSGPAGILRPGQSGQLTLKLLSNDTMDGDQIPVQVSQIEAGQTIDWTSQQATLRPPTIPTAAWNVIYGNLLTMVGTTTVSYNAALAQAATYLSGLGETTAQVSDVTTLFSYLIAQASADFPTRTLTSAVDASLSTPGSLPLAIDRTFNSSIDGRSDPGIFGLGWTTFWQTALSVDSSGNVTMNSDGVVGYFPVLTNGTYLDTDGEFGTLTLSAGIYTFTDSLGNQYVFTPVADAPGSPGGLLNYEQDTKGNRITLGYNSQNQLVTLTYSNPPDPSEPSEQLSLTYNAQGFVSQESDGIGDVWSYTYDGAGHLLSVTVPGPTAAGLTTSYSYDTGSNPETANALLSITNPDGTQQNFTYDGLGRLSGASANSRALATTYVYLGEGEVKETDSAGDQTIVWFNDLGLAARVQDPLGGISTSLYDTNGNLVSTTDAAGDTYQYAYDSNGNLTKTVNPLGQTVQMTYGSLSKLTSITDAQGNTTQYNYSPAGNLLSITYPDGTQQSFTYDPLGNPTATTLQNGDSVSFQYNSQGLVTQQNFADGTSQTFTYDAHGNMLTAQTFDAGGNLTGTTTLTYNNGNELTSITYPSGQYLNFAYNAQGQRIQSVDQSGYTLAYSYDDLGRLVGLSDGSGMVVTYTYNNLGQLSEKQNGNGTYTTYAYDAAGNLTSEINSAPGGAINSSFVYTYNVLNEITSMTDAAGNVPSYGYDATGQLTEVTLPGGQSITYVYNAAGDRTEVINNVTPTNYASNADNEITQVGQATYTYDANGNLATVTDASGTTTYNYNDLNELVSITAADGTVTTFQYSPLGFMTGMIVNGTQTNYLVDPTGLGNVVAAYDGSGSLIADYNYGLGLVSQTGPSGTGYYDFDGSGNTVGITGSSGSYVNQYSYLPFGETTTVSAALPNPFTFAGKAGVMQIGGNLFYMRARDYTPATGQFTSRDPLGLAGGDANIRRYVGNNPVGSIDPTGLDSSVQSLISQYATMYGIDPNLAAALVQVYSGGNPNAVGNNGTSIGLLQLNQANYPNTNLQSPEQNLKVGLADFANLLKRSGSIPQALARFDGSMDPSGFVNKVLRIYHATNKRSNDPNALIGPAGYGTQSFIQPTGVLPYTVDFENDGTAAAQDVTVTEQLDSNLDWSTFQLGSFGFGPVNVTIPAGLTEYQTTVSYQNSDGSSLNVLVTLDFSVATGLLNVTFVSLDPLTGPAPTGVFDGFLYPENGTGVGEGYVQYTIQPNSGLTTGTTITQGGDQGPGHPYADVVFDTNPPLYTNEAINTIDAGPPTSSVNPLPSTSLADFTVSWSGHDDPGGSGIASYNVYDSDNGGPVQLWQSATTATSALFTGAMGHTYTFYSVGTDNAGNVQSAPLAAQATTSVNANLGIITNPMSQTVAVGQSATFKAAAAGTPKPMVQWQVSADDGSTWSNVSGATTTTLTVTATQAQNGDEYRAVFTSSAGQGYTTDATLTVSFMVQATTKPEALTVLAGTPLTLTAAASGDPPPAVQWQVSTNQGKTFSAITGATSTSYGFTAQAGSSGNMYEAVFTNGIGKPVSTAAITLTVDAAAPAVTANPTPQSAAVGGTATFTVSGSGSPTPTVQWQVSTDGGHTFSNVAGATKATLTLNQLTAAEDGGLYRAVFLNAVGQATSAAALLTVHFAPMVTIQPTSQTAAAGTQVTFTGGSSAEPTATVQWMISTNHGKNFGAITGATSPSYSFTADAGDSGNLYEAIFTNGIGAPATTKAAALTIAMPPGVQANPTSRTAVHGAATFSVAPTGTTPKLQWQVSTNGGTTWSNVPGATSATLALKSLTGAEDQWRYRVLVTNALGTFTSGAATLTVQFAPVVTKQPLSQAAAAGTQVTFTAAVHADPAATVQWMVSTNKGKTYSAITGANSPSYSFTAEASDSGNLYEAVFTNGIGKAATTAAAALTIDVPPGVEANPTNQTASSGAATFSVVPTGTSPKVQWQVSTNGGAAWSNVTGATSATLALKGLTGAEDQRQYRVLVTNALRTFTSGAATLTVLYGPVISA